MHTLVPINKTFEKHAYMCTYIRNICHIYTTTAKMIGNIFRMRSKKRWWWCIRILCAHTICTCASISCAINKYSGARIQFNVLARAFAHVQASISYPYRRAIVGHRAITTRLKSSLSPFTCIEGFSNCLHARASSALVFCLCVCDILRWKVLSSVVCARALVNEKTKPT